MKNLLNKIRNRAKRIPTLKFLYRKLKKTVYLIRKKYRSYKSRQIKDYNAVITKNGTVKMKTVADLNFQYCVGCASCYNSCPKKCITMGQDEYGFYSPVIDFDICINCGNCVKHCPVINFKYDRNSKKETKCFAVMMSDDVRKISSSGGAFTALTEYIYSLNPSNYVFGAELDDNLTVRHSFANSLESANKFKGSKYVQSYLGNTYSEVKRTLNETGKTVLFTGTPCQVAGLYAYLGKDYDNLITADLICHGAPSKKVFDKYIEDEFGKDNIKSYRFRTKEYGYNSMHCIAYLKDGTVSARNRSFDAYEKIMHSGISLKDICRNCYLARVPRQGDFTIGDYWGVSSYKKELNDNIGTSCLLVNNAKAMRVFNEMRNGFKLVEETPLKFAIRHNRLNAGSNAPAVGRKSFYHMLDHQNINKTADYSLNHKYDIGIIGLWYGRNYGSMATYFALNKYLTGRGLSVLMIENCFQSDTQTKFEKSHPKHIADEYYEVSKRYQVKELSNLNGQCDSFVIGSDQLWNLHLSRPYGQMYYLGFVNDETKKIAYGTSMGINWIGTPEENLIVSHNLNRFDHISVRDKMTKDTCKEIFGFDPDIVCDPCFLPAPEIYDELIDKADVNTNGDYILAYILDPSDSKIDLLRSAAIKYNMNVMVIINESPRKREENRLWFSGVDNVTVLDVPDLKEWLKYYKHSTMVITDSFHGTIFSIIFQKPFLSIINEFRGAERFISLLEPLGLLNRLYDNNISQNDNLDKLKALDYAEANIKLENIKEYSRAWLDNALYSEKKTATYKLFRTTETNL